MRFGLDPKKDTSRFLSLGASGSAHARIPQGTIPPSVYPTTALDDPIAVYIIRHNSLAAFTSSVREEINSVRGNMMKVMNSKRTRLLGRVTSGQRAKLVNFTNMELEPKVFEMLDSFERLKLAKAELEISGVLCGWAWLRDKAVLAENICEAFKALEGAVVMEKRLFEEAMELLRDIK